MSDKDWLVYLHINKINHKVYVGITHYVENPNIRWCNGMGYTHCIKFHNSIIKYGWDSFSHIILCRTSKDKACIIERALIHLYKSKGLCYNIAEGGEGSNSFSRETKRKLSSSLKGRAIKKESIDKMVSTRRKQGSYSIYPSWLWNRDVSGANNPFYGRKHSKATLAKKYKAVLQYDKDNALIAEYSSIKEAALAVSTTSTVIVGALRGRTKTAKGFIWKYKNE